MYYTIEAATPALLAHTPNPGNPKGFPEVPTLPIPAPASPSSSQHYYVPEGYPLPNAGWWASVEGGHVLVHDRQETRARIPQVSYWGALSGLEIGDELMVPYESLEGLLRVLSWAVTPREGEPEEPEGDQALELWVSWARGVISPLPTVKDGSVTRRGLSEALERAGVEGPAKELILRKTASHRHEWRVRETIDTLRCWPHPIDSPRWALVVLLADAIGLGTTERHPLLRGLGKGRREASDGGAWMAAASDAFVRIAAGPGVLVVDATPTGEVVGRWGDEAGAVDEPWARLVLARAGLLAAFNLPYLKPGTGEELTWAGFRFEGAAPNWALAVNQAEAAYALASDRVEEQP